MPVPGEMFLTRIQLLACCVLPLLLPTAAGAQELLDRTMVPIPDDAATTAAPTSQDQVRFSAARLEYDYEGDVVTATGDVFMQRDGERLRADQVTWDRATGKVLATGDIAVTNPGGDTAYGDRIELTDTLRDGVVDNMLVVLDRGSRLAADRGTRAPDGKISLDRAAYTACSVTASDNCPKQPTWKVTAVRVLYDPAKSRVFYTDARLHLFGLTTPPLPGFSHPIGDASDSGLLSPRFALDRVNGFEVAAPYFLRFGTNKALTVTPHVYTAVLPMLEANYRALSEQGAFNVSGYATASRRTQNTLGSSAQTGQQAFRGYIDGTGTFQFDPNWRLSGSLRLVTDSTFLRRYDLSRDDRLRTTLALERVDRDSYLSIAGWAVQTLRVNDRQGLQPVALPEIDYRRREEGLAGGVLSVQLNSLAIGRKAGQDVQRAFASAQWDWRRYTPLGQVVTATAFARADAYHVDDAGVGVIPVYAGSAGFEGRGIVAGALDVQWPFIGPALGGVQRFTPRVQIVASPKLRNLGLPNEDSRAVDLESSNLFSLNRFPGYDRFEDSSRVTYGAEYALNLPGFTIDAVVGQSYRLTDRATILPDGTGLSDRFSDIVGRTELRFRDFVSLTHRYRLDKDGLAVRRNEVDATIGSRATYALIGYLRLNRNIALEDLQDREELRAAGRVRFARFWSAFASTVIDLTDRNEDVLSVADGFDPIRHRVGVTYEDDCLELGLTWKRDYQDRGDARRGNAFLLSLAFKNLGR